jgi:hypothetical protein
MRKHDLHLDRRQSWCVSTDPEHGSTEIHRSLKTEPDWSLFDSVRDDCFKQLRICVWVQLYDPEIVQVRLRGDLLNVVRLSILDIDHIFSSVLKPTDQHKVTKGTDMSCGLV